MTTKQTIGQRTPSRLDDSLTPQQINQIFKNHPPKKQELKQPPTQEPQQETTTSPITSLDDYILIKNINCTDSNGNIFESYPEIYIAKNHTPNSQTIYAHVSEAEQDNEFIPSFALTCNILTTIFPQAIKLNKDQPSTILNQELVNIINQYKNWHIQNTIVNYQYQQIIHNPKDSDFTDNGGTNNINQKLNTIRLPFNKSKLADRLLQEAIKKPKHKEFLINFTGLSNPLELESIAKYLGKPAKSWVPDDIRNASYTASTFIGCDDSGFDLDALSDFLSYNYASRRVRIAKNFSSTK